MPSFDGFDRYAHPSPHNERPADSHPGCESDAKGLQAQGLNDHSRGPDRSGLQAVVIMCDHGSTRRVLNQYSTLAEPCSPPECDYNAGDAINALRREATISYQRGLAVAGKTLHTHDRHR
jgi:hypothetical protein